MSLLLYRSTQEKKKRLATLMYVFLQHKSVCVCTCACHTLTTLESVANYGVFFLCVCVHVHVTHDNPCMSSQLQCLVGVCVHVFVMH